MEPTSSTPAEEERPDESVPAPIGAPDPEPLPDAAQTTVDVPPAA